MLIEWYFILKRRSLSLPKPPFASFIPNSSPIWLSLSFGEMSLLSNFWVLVLPRSISNFVLHRISNEKSKFPIYIAEGLRDSYCSERVFVLHRCDQLQKEITPLLPFIHMVDLEHLPCMRPCAQVVKERSGGHHLTCFPHCLLWYLWWVQLKESSGELNFFLPL